MNQNEIDLSWKLPILIVILALLTVLGFQLSQVLRERTALSATLINLSKQFDDGAKMREQAVGVVDEAIKLADQNNVSANQAIDDLKRQNVDLRSIKKQLDDANIGKDKTDKK